MRSRSIPAMLRAFRRGVPFWCGQAEPRRPCAGLKVLFALIALMPERHFYLGTAYYFLDQYSESVEAMDHALAGSLGLNTQITGRSVLAAAYAQLDRRPDAERERNAVMRIAPILKAELFASQFGTQTAHDHMLVGLKKAGFH